MRLFNEVPDDVDPMDLENYNKALRYFSDHVDVKEEDECWLSYEELDQSKHFYYFGTKTLQQAAVILNGPIVDTSRRVCKIVSVCANIDCCNPDHLWLVNKRNTLDEAIREVIMMDDEGWSKLRHLIHTQEEVRAKRVVELVNRLNRAGLSVDNILSTKQELRELTQHLDWAYNTAILTYLGRDGNIERHDRFFHYLRSQGILTAYYKLPKDWKEVVKQLMKCPIDKGEIPYFQRVLLFVAKETNNTQLLTQLDRIGVGGIHEDH